MKISIILFFFWSGFVFSLKESEMSKVYKLLGNQKFYQIKSFEGTRTNKDIRSSKKHVDTKSATSTTATKISEINSVRKIKTKIQNVKELENSKKNQNATTENPIKKKAKKQIRKTEKETRHIRNNTKDMQKNQKQKTVFLRYAKFGKGKEKKGSIIFVNGWAENLLKYTELFYDLHIKGFSPIYTYDHRGQGFSDRILSDSRVGYVENYSFYRKDLKTFIERVLKDSELNKDNLFLIAHSMGGAIVLDYLQTYPSQKYFKAVVLSSPLLKIQIAHPIFDSLILKALKLICKFFCLKPVPRIKAKYVERSLMTNSSARANFVTYIEKQFPQVILDRPSYHWTLESFSAVNRVMQEDRIKKIHTPLLILQAEKEVLVSNKYQDSFCEKIPKRCYVKKLTGRHEHFLETDIVRNKAIQETIRFFSQTRFSRD